MVQCVGRLGGGGGGDVMVQCVWCVCVMLWYSVCWGGGGE